MILSRRITLVSLTILALTLLVPVARANAIEGESITLSPANVRYDFEPNQVVTDELTVINDGTVAYDAIVYAGPYSVENTTYKPDYTSIKPRTDVYKWVQFSQTKWHLDPGQKITVPYTIRVPSNVSPGGHYGVIFAETQPTDNSGSLSRKKRVGSIIYSSVKGTAEESGQTDSIELETYQRSAPLAATIKVTNNGNVDYEMKERMKVYDLFGGLRYDSGEVMHIIFPATSRNIAASWDKPQWVGLYKVDISSEVLGKASEKSSYVLMMPIWMIVSVLITLVLLIANVILRKKTPRK